VAKTLGDNGRWGADQQDALLRNVGSYQAAGATGNIAFDQYGDSTNKVLTVYQVTSGKWVPAQTGTFEG
jgi:branched-chain amino acid transport system substrate-binding protein